MVDFGPRWDSGDTFSRFMTFMILTTFYDLIPMRNCISERARVLGSLDTSRYGYWGVVIYLNVTN